jgi:zinc/manganese transport system ATP-binding protein
MNVIDLDRASIHIGDRTVLSDITISVGAGEFIGVLGPNGSGKTTLMRALLGLIKPSSGTIRVFGRPPQRGDAAIGYVPQVRTVLPELRMRGLDVVASCLHGERWGIPTLVQADRRMIEDTLAAMGARDLADRPLSEMSGGERQRLLLAQALIGSPRLLLLDEPLISLDPRHQEAVIDFIRQFGRSEESPSCSAHTNSTSFWASLIACFTSAGAGQRSAPSLKS